MPKDIVPIRATTQSFTEIEDISKNLVLFRDGSCAMVLTTSAVNFGLLSEKEQEALIYSYAGLLNSLSFPVQILIRTQQKDISSYLEKLEEQEKKQKNPHLAASIHSYRTFIADTVKERNVLDKKFYLVITFSYLELGVSPSLIFGNTKKGLPYPKEYILEKANLVLSPKRDQITRLIARIGLKVDQLDTNQLIRLFFTIYNPGVPMPEKLQEIDHT